MVIICEGTDNVGKGTQINKITEYLQKNGVTTHNIHYSNIKTFGDDFEEVRKHSYQMYKDMMKLINFAAQDDKMCLILDRAHLGEYVYSPLFRGYSGKPVMGLEDNFVWPDNRKNVKLILFSDTPENLVLRDDGLSLSDKIEYKKKEVEAFKEAFDLSIFNKKFIELKGRNAEEIWKEEVLPFIKLN